MFSPPRAAGRMEQSNEVIVRSILARIRHLRLRSVRQRTGLHFIEGFRPFLQVIDAHLPIETVVYSEVLAQNPIVQKKVRLTKREGVRVLRVSPEQFRSISLTPRASGIGTILPQHWTPLDQVDPHRGLCWVAVRFLRSPGNLGTIMRTAEAVGAGGLILLGDSIDLFDPNIVRASMGGIFRLQVVRTTIEAFGMWSRQHECQVLGTSPMADSLYTEVPLTPPILVLFGEERAGLTPEELAVCTHRARIPIVGCADSLNVGVAAGVILYEMLRRHPAAASQCVMDG